MEKQIFNIKNEDEFERLALQIYNYQIKNNPIYEKYTSLILKGKKPKNTYFTKT